MVILFICWWVGLEREEKDFPESGLMAWWDLPGSALIVNLVRSAVCTIEDNLPRLSTPLGSAHPPGSKLAAWLLEWPEKAMTRET